MKFLFCDRLAQVLLTWIILVTRNFLEAVVQGEVVPDGVLPARLALLIKREIVRHVLIDLAQRELFLVRVLDGHGDERGVGVGWAHQLQQLLLTCDGEPAEVRTREPGRVGEILPLGAVGRSDERRIAVSV